MQPEGFQLRNHIPNYNGLYCLPARYIDFITAEDAGGQSAGPTDTSIAPQQWYRKLMKSPRLLPRHLNAPLNFSRTYWSNERGFAYEVAFSDENVTQPGLS